MLEGRVLLHKCKTIEWTRNWNDVVFNLCFEY